MVGAVPAGLVSAGVVALVQGGLQTMSTVKLAVTAVLALAVAVLGAGGFCLLPSDRTAPTASAAAPPVPPPEPRKESRDRHVAEFYRRTGHPAAAAFYEARDNPDARPEPAPEPPPAGRTSGALQRYLRQWEKEAGQARSLSADVTRTETNGALRNSTVFVGTARIVGLDRGKVELHTRGKADVKKFLLVGTKLYEEAPATKEIVRWPVTAANGWPASVAWLPLVLFRAGPAEVVRAANPRLVKEDRWYVYVDLQPRRRTGGPSWSRGRLVLSKANGLPRQLWLEYPGGNEVNWDFVRVKVGSRVDHKEFEARVPPGWKIVERR
jgi:hypothetical protein